MAKGAAFALRLDVTRALGLVPKSLAWEDLSRGVQTAEPAMFGDVVLAVALFFAVLRFATPR
jgi:glutamyl-Q tRNA(Asp) synthetase